MPGSQHPHCHRSCSLSTGVGQGSELKLRRQYTFHKTLLAHGLGGTLSGLATPRHCGLAAPHQSRRCLVPPTVKTASSLPLERSQPTWSEVRLTRTSSPSQWSCCFWLEQERRNTRRGRSRRRCLPRGPSVRISCAPAIRLHHTSVSLGPSDRTKLDRCSRAGAGLAAGSTAGVATRLSRRAFGCGLVSGLSGRPNDGAQSRNFSAR